LILAVAGCGDTDGDCPEGRSKCDEGKNGFRTCGNHDDDACQEWSAVTECGSDEICQDGECIEFDDCCDYPEQGYHCCLVFHFCVKDFW